MVIAGVEERVPMFNVIVGIVPLLVNVSMVVKFTLKIRRPNRMDQPAMGMPVCSVAVIRIGMDVNEGNQQDPESDPRKHYHTEQATFSALISHH